MARSKSTRWYAALAVLLVFVLLAWLLGGVLTLTEGERVALRVGLVVLGLMAAGSLLWFLRPVAGRRTARAAASQSRSRRSAGQSLDISPSGVGPGRRLCRK